MSLSDPIADMLSRIRNAQMVKHRSVGIPYSKMKEGIAQALQREGYIRGYKVNSEERSLVIDLKYTSFGPVIRNLRRVSKPSLRVYTSLKKMPRVANGLGNAILSTSRGIFSDLEARKQSIGGEVLFFVA